jgi:glycine/D-amino acid oxidase-like deaminating enzyme
MSNTKAMHETFSKSLWSALTPSAVPIQPLEGSLSCDVAVVGAGFLGLSLALHLAEQGVRVVVLEADDVGFGASGRNTGFVVPRLKGSLGQEAVTRMLGGDHAERLLRLVGGAGDGVFDLIKRLGIDCDAEQNGFLAPAPSDATMRSVEKQVRESTALGQPLLALDATQTRARVGFGGYRGALFVPSGGQLNPLAYVRGLARAAQAAGVTLRQGRVTQIDADRLVAGAAPGSGGWRLRVDTAVSAAATSGVAHSAEVRAARVVLTTNALVGQLRGDVARSLFPFAGFQIASQVMSEAIRSTLLPQNQPMADMRNSPFALRWSRDGRLVGGGAAILPTAGAMPRMADYFARKFNDAVPQLPPIRPEFQWRGIIAGTGDFLPRLWQSAPGLYAPIGCNGRGVALTTALGRVFATYLTDGDVGALPVPLEAPKPFPMHGLARFGPSLWLAQARWRDARRPS